MFPLILATWYAKGKQDINLMYYFTQNDNTLFILIVLHQNKKCRFTHNVWYAGF